MRNSLLIEKFCAADLSGLKLCTEVRNSIFIYGVVGKRSLLQRRSTVKLAGAQRSANAGMSNRISDENSERRKTKVSSAMSIS